MAQTVVVECICCMASGFDDQALLICKGSKKVHQKLSSDLGSLFTRVAEEHRRLSLIDIKVGKGC